MVIRGGLRGVARASAHGAGDVHVGQELHVQADGARAVAFGAAQLPRVVGEVARFQPGRLGFGRAREGAAQLVVHPGVGGHGGAHVRADGRGVDEVRPLDARGFDALDVGGKLRAARVREKTMQER